MTIFLAQVQKLLVQKFEHILVISYMWQSIDIKRQLAQNTAYNTSSNSLLTSHKMKDTSRRKVFCLKSFTRAAKQTVSNFTSC
jgi:hypothetical protein